MQSPHTTKPSFLSFLYQKRRLFCTIFVIALFLQLCFLAAFVLLAPSHSSSSSLEFAQVAQIQHSIQVNDDSIIKPQVPVLLQTSPAPPPTEHARSEAAPKESTTYLDEIFLRNGAQSWSKDFGSYQTWSQCFSSWPRDYRRHPVVVIASGLVSSTSAETCDVPCFSTDRQDDTFSYRYDAGIEMDLGMPLQVRRSCPHQRHARLSMESGVYYSSNLIPNDLGQRRDMMMTVQLKSNVTAGYYSWIDYGIMESLNLQRKQGNAALGAAFISNCGGNSNRLSIMQELIDNGVPIDSMGRCNHNKDEPGGRGKVDVLRDYKFGMAFENTVWEDYVTEKLFQVYVAGAIPIVVGAPNSHDYEPLPETMLYVGDYPNVQALASKVKEIANNETLFKWYTRYKTVRPSDKFLALYDISAPHSRCRMCVKMADLMDEEYGEYKYGRSKLQDLDQRNGRTIRVRERNRYFFQDVYVSDLSIDGLRKAIMSALVEAFHQPVWRNVRPKILDTEKFEIYRIYKMYPRNTMWDTMKNDDILIKNDIDVQNLKTNERIEVILV